MIGDKKIAGANEERKCKLDKTIENTKIVLKRIITLVVMKIYKKRGYLLWAPYPCLGSREMPWHDAATLSAERRMPRTLFYSLIYCLQPLVWLSPSLSHPMSIGCWFARGFEELCAWYFYEKSLISFNYIDLWYKLSWVKMSRWLSTHAPTYAPARSYLCVCAPTDATVNV